jgi:putative acetyltransferase
MWLRAESPADHAAIRALIEAAFAGAAHASGTEARIVDALRADDALTVSMVADLDGAVIGHVALSPVRIDGNETGWHGLGPVAVAPAHQGHGVGFALVQAALTELRMAGSRGCVVLGDAAYYGRFGFRHVAGLVYPPAPPEYFMALAFGHDIAQGEVSYQRAFDAT